MAQIVGYFQNNVEYTEGPFVYSTIGRVEVELKGHHCPVLCDPSIYHMLQAEREDYRQGAHVIFEKLEPVIDWLNQQVILGRIQCKENGSWVAVQYAECKTPA